MHPRSSQGMCRSMAAFKHPTCPIEASREAWGNRVRFRLARGISFEQSCESTLNGERIALMSSLYLHTENVR